MVLGGDNMGIAAVSIRFYIYLHVHHCYQHGVSYHRGFVRSLDHGSPCLDHGSPYFVNGPEGNINLINVNVFFLRP